MEYYFRYFETHATSTTVGDSEETAAIDEVFCKNQTRDKPLMVGSVKSNMGHAEGASGLSSIAKIILTFENRQIPPMINLKNLRQDIEAFASKRIVPVTKVTPLEGDFIPFNNYGIAGSNAHALLEGNKKVKINSGIAEDEMPRVVCWSGRSEEALNSIFDGVMQKPLDAEFIALLQNSQRKTITLNNFRGFAIFEQKHQLQNAMCKERSVKRFDGKSRQIAWVFAGMGSQWISMGRSLIKIPLALESIKKSHEVLKQFDIDLIEIITSEDPNTFKDPINSYVGIISIEIALTDILRQIGVEPDFIIGHSVGEIGCAYADGCLTVEEAILAAYARGKSSVEAQNIKGKFSK